jgi:hypothetical protein
VVNSDLTLNDAPVTPSPTPSITPTITLTPTITPTISLTPTNTPTPTPTPNPVILEHPTYGGVDTDNPEIACSHLSDYQISSTLYSYSSEGMNPVNGINIYQIRNGNVLSAPVIGGLNTSFNVFKWNNGTRYTFKAVSGAITLLHQCNSSTNFLISSGYNVLNKCDGLGGNTNSVYGNTNDWMTVNRFYTNSNMTTAFNGGDLYYGDSNSTMGTVRRIGTDGISYNSNDFAC